MIDDERIVGGTQASPNEFPYQISLRVCCRNSIIHVAYACFNLSIFNFNHFSAWAPTFAALPFTRVVGSSQLPTALTGECNDIELNASNIEKRRLMTNETLIWHQLYVETEPLLVPYPSLLVNTACPSIPETSKSVMLQLNTSKFSEICVKHKHRFHRFHFFFKLF